ncbi:efflux transporter outer membrane subunit, partial [Akkermansiaceae bacterium]|nr:efflux transporter outer membrane subunit [Akkermansiaceae bacterium]
AGKWWSSFSDSKLSSLLSQAEKANPEAQAALARLDQSRAILGLSRADRIPTLTGEALISRQRDTQRDVFELPGEPYTRYRAALNLNYEIDFWGRVRRTINRQKALTQAVAADYITAQLSTKAEVARDYLALRHLDEEIQLLANTVKLREENEGLVKVRVDVGATTPIDSSRARSLTETARAELFRLKQRRTELENAIAVLTGANPSSFRIGQASPPRTPSIPAGVPADLLRRRPDVAATERRLASAAEEVGITLASYLPRVSLTASSGFAALSASELFDSRSRLWNFGPEVSFSTLTFGRKKNDVERARATYREGLAKHRQSVLSAFRDVENALSGITNLDRALAAQRKSADASEEAARLIQLRYDTGIVSFFEVIAAQRESLTEQRALSQTRAARQQATVQLIQALGGGWR